MKKYIVFILYLIVASCQPEKEPVDMEPEPVFYAKGTINGKTLGIEAGINGNVMDARLKTDSTGLILFNGYLGNKTCSSCGPSLTFTIRNYVNSTSFSVDSALSARTYEFYNSNVAYKKYYLADFYGQSSGDGSSVTEWEFGNNTGNGEKTSYKGNHVRFRIESEGDILVKQSDVYSSGCTSVNQQNVRVPSQSESMLIDFNINYIDDHTILFNTIPVEQSTTWSWNFGDGSTAEGNLVKHTYDSTNVYKVCMIRDSTVFCKYINTKNSKVCVSNFSYKITTVLDKLQLSNVKIEWRDSNGRLYTSDAADNENSEFRIVETSPYHTNEKGEKTMKLKVLLTCNVSDGLNVIELKDVEAVIAVAY